MEHPNLFAGTSTCRNVLQHLSPQKNESKNTSKLDLSLQDATEIDSPVLTTLARGTAQL